MKPAGAGIPDESCAAPAARWRSRGLVSVVVILLGVLIAMAASKPQDASRKFSHRDHVSTHWYGDGTGRGRDVEYARDCRGCHDATADTRPDPRQVCNACHFDQQLVEDARGGWVLRADVRPGAAQPNVHGQYKHADHQSLACRECHAPVNGDEEVHVPSAASTGLCMRCHDKTAPAALERVVSDAVAPVPVDFESLRSRLLARLNSDPGMKADDRGPFLHRDHMTAAELTQSEKCGNCHAGVPSSSARDLVSKAFDASACGACHITPNEAPVEVIGGLAAPKFSTEKPLPFDHRDHLRSEPGANVLRNCTAQATHTVFTDGCLACHEHQRAGDAPTFALRGDFASYEGCVTCHDVERFKTKDHGRWDGCVGCHDFARNGMKRNRIVTQVIRPEPGSVTFVMPPAAHPGLQQGQTVQQCAECHKAALPSTASRTGGAKFDHAQHLPKDPSPESCDACHAKRIGQSAGSASIGYPFPPGRSVNLDELRADAESLMTFDIGACQSCHPGVAIDAKSLAQLAPRSVPEFSHAQHMRKGQDPMRPGQPVQCATCHRVNATERGAPVDMLDGAFRCTLCHEHDAAHAAWTGGVQGAEVTSCVVCHRDRMPVPKEVPYSSKWFQVALSGAQLHPDDRSCAQCHIDTPTASSPSTAVVQAEGALYKIHADNRYPGDCRSCHWALKSNSLGDQSPSLETRKREGASLVDFPGGEESNAMRQRFLESRR